MVRLLTEDMLFGIVESNLETCWNGLMKMVLVIEIVTRFGGSKKSGKLR